MTFISKHRLAIRNTLTLSILFVVLCFLSGCRDLPKGVDWTSSVQNCWSCTLYKAAFDAINNLVTHTYQSMATNGLMVLGVGLLFWLSFRTLKMVTSLHEPNLQEYALDVIHTLFRALIVTAILLAGNSYVCVLDMIVTPVLTGFAALSRIVLTANTNINQGIVWPAELGGTTLDQCNLFSGFVSYQYQDLIFRVYIALNSGISLGYYVMSEKSFLNWIVGPFIMYMFFMMSLIFPLMFIDSFIKLGAVLVLSPFIFVAWVFKATRKATQQAWNIVFGSTMQILVACIYIGLVVGVIELFASNNWPGMLGESRQTADPSMMANFRRLSTEAISFFALILILNRMQRNIPKISGYLGGDETSSAMIGFVDGAKQAAISVTQIAIGAALSAMGIPAGATLMKAGAQRLAEQAKDAAESAVQETMDTGSGGGGEDGSTGDSMSSRAKGIQSAAKQGAKSGAKTAKGAADGAKQGAQMGKVAGPKGAAVGAVVGGVAGGVKAGGQEVQAIAEKIGKEGSKSSNQGGQKPSEK